MVWVQKYRKKLLHGKISEGWRVCFMIWPAAVAVYCTGRSLMCGACTYVVVDSTKHGVTEVVGYLERKSAIETAKHFEKVRKIRE